MPPLPILSATGNITKYICSCQTLMQHINSRCVDCRDRAFSALTLWLGGRKGILPIKTEWWGAGVVICLERGADLHVAQLMPLPLTVSCFSKIQIGFTFLVPAHLGSPGNGR